MSTATANPPARALIALTDSGPWDFGENVHRLDATLAAHASVEIGTEAAVGS